MMIDADLKSRAREIAKSPWSYASTDITEIIYELLMAGGRRKGPSKFIDPSALLDTLANE